VIEILDNNHRRGSVVVTYISPNIYGAVSAPDVEKSIINGRTCLIILPALNIATGAINDIGHISTVAHKHKIPLFCDYIGAFGVLPIDPRKIDAFALDLNYPNLRLLVVKKELIRGYRLYNSATMFQPVSEEHSILDGPTYGLARTIVADVHKKVNQKSTTKRMLGLREHVVKALKSRCTATNRRLYFYSAVVETNTTPAPGDVIIFGPGNTHAPHIISIMIVKLTKKNKAKTCEVNRLGFEKMGVIDKYIPGIITMGLLSPRLKKEDITKFIYALLPPQP
jgi:hypothetical protein